LDSDGFHASVSAKLYTAVRYKTLAQILFTQILMSAIGHS